jgi:hypothetical protein
VTPPQLTRDTPILHVLHPSSPVSSRDLGLDLELAGIGSLLSETDPFFFTYLESLLGHGLAADPPLGLHDLLNNIAGSRTDWDLHLIVLGLDVETLLLECFDDLVPDVESLHSLQISYQSRD